MTARKKTPPPHRGTWLIDGHNTIHHVPSLATRQRTGEGEQARDRLIEACRRFALHHRLQVLLIFDGSSRVAGIRLPTYPHLKVLYATGDGGADASIVERATELEGKKIPTTVVSDDRKLKNDLPRRVWTLTVREFWAQIERSEDEIPEEKKEERLPDVEQFFLDAEPRIEEELRKSGRRPRRLSAEK